MLIPLVDLRAQHRQIADELHQRFARLFEKTAFILGEEVASFEHEFARFSGVKHCVGVANGTDALEMMLRAVGIGSGDEVIVPTNSFVATAGAVVRAGAIPGFVDSDPQTHLIDVQAVAQQINRRTKAIVPVHLYGQIAPMEELKAVADRTGVLLLEDAAHAQGARHHKQGIASIGLAAATSFYPSKNLGAYGDGGAVLTNSDEVATAVRALRNYGSETKHHHPRLGFNSRLDAIQAVVLSAKLKHLAHWNKARRQAALRYDELLSGVDAVTLPVTLAGNEHVWHLYVVCVPRRDAVLRKLNEAGIGAALHYPLPIHLQGAFKHLCHQKGDFPVAEAVSEQILSLPIFPEITVEQQIYVASELKRSLSKVGVYERGERRSKVRGTGLQLRHKSAPP
jgi:dTDP-4-amino-4,6-dideoxygalactose transaminase